MIMQFDYVMSLIKSSPARFPLTLPIILELHRLAIQDIYTCAGRLRTVPIYITNTAHQPPPPEDVPRLVEEMCAYVDTNWHRSAVHLAAYLMWRHNWIHPFCGGNGRTSRAISYLVLCTKLGFVLPGVPTIPEQIVTRRDLYYAALRAADDALVRTGAPDVRAMEQMLSDMLANQLISVHRQAVSDSSSARSK